MDEREILNAPVIAHAADIALKDGVTERKPRNRFRLIKTIFNIPMVAILIAFLASFLFIRETNRPTVFINVPTEMEGQNENTAAPPKKIAYMASDFENGDIIFRRGVSLESRVIGAMDGNNGFSHSGIIRKSDSGIEVIHASFGEEGQTKENVICESIESFLKNSSASAGAAYRYVGPNGAVTRKTALSEAERFLNEKISFDGDFDLSNIDRIYCTELVWQAYKKAGVDLIEGKFDHIPYLFGDPQKDYILPSSLLNYPQMEKVWQFN